VSTALKYGVFLVCAHRTAADGIQTPTFQRRGDDGGGGALRYVFGDVTTTTTLL
jgi:hypothetical protein